YTSATGEQIAAIAKQYVGVPYVYGGATPAGFDCSGFTSFVYARAGISIPRSSSGQHALGGVVPASAAPVGALMTWDGHTGIYLGGGMHIAARNPGTPLSISPIYRSGAVYHVLF
ncbi:MAG: C40 family peptidase, partial [Actinomycetota bacterium]